MSTFFDLQMESIGGETVAYDQLALTTGSVPNRLPARMGGDLDHVFTVRSLADIDRMQPFFARNARVLIVGGGYIGLEAAAVCCTYWSNCFFASTCSAIARSRMPGPLAIR